jgi:type VI protein secretion system component Hcp
MSDHEQKVPQLSDEELTKVVGGEISFSYTNIEYTYTQQKSDGPVAAPAKPPVKK